MTEVTFTYATKNTGTLHTEKATSIENPAYPSGTAVALANVQSVTAYVGNTGTATNGQVAVQVIAVKYAVSTDPVVTITNKPASLTVGDLGEFTASGTNATNPTYAWSSSDDTVLEVLEDGTYEAKKAGTATVTVAMTCDEGSANASMDLVVDAGLITLAQANEIAAGLAQGTSTTYNVTIEGYVVNLDADNKGAGNERALMLSTAKVGEEGTQLQVFGVYNGNNSVRNYMVLNSTVRYTGKLADYSGTKQLSSPKLVSYSDDAMTFAKVAYEGLQESCNTGVAAVTASEWATAKALFELVDTYSQAKLKAADVSKYGEDIVKWVARYEKIVANTELEDFMQRGVVAAAVTTNNNNNNAGIIALIVVAAVASLSLASVVTIVIIKKRRFSR